MLKRTLALAGLLIIATATSGFGQAKFEATANFGWSVEDGVSGQPFPTLLGTFDRVDPKDAFLFGLGLGFMFTDNAEVGFQWSKVSSKLVVGGVGGTQDAEIGDMSVLNH